MGGGVCVIGIFWLKLAENFAQIFEFPFIFGHPYLIYFEIDRSNYFLNFLFFSLFFYYFWLWLVAYLKWFHFPFYFIFTQKITAAIHFYLPSFLVVMAFCKNYPLFFYFPKNCSYCAFVWWGNTHTREQYAPIRTHCRLTDQQVPCVFAGKWGGWLFE